MLILAFATAKDFINFLSHYLIGPPCLLDFNHIQLKSPCSKSQKAYVDRLTQLLYSLFGFPSPFLQSNDDSTLASSRKLMTSEFHSVSAVETRLRFGAITRFSLTLTGCDMHTREQKQPIK